MYTGAANADVLVSWLTRVPRKYDFKLGAYTTSNGARSVEYGWWIARWNTNTSFSSNVFLVSWHGALSWGNTTFHYEQQSMDAFPQRMRLDQNSTLFP